MNIVLHEPGIALNTGNIGRTCAATDTSLHLIRPYGFHITEKEIKRAGMDYWDKIDLHEYVDYDDFLSAHPEITYAGEDMTADADIDVDAYTNAEAEADADVYANANADVNAGGAKTATVLASEIQNSIAGNCGNADAKGRRPKLWFATTKATQCYSDVSFSPDDYIMLGNESRGIPEEILVQHPGACIRIPMWGDIRSLNLANSAAIILYEALRQNGFEHMNKLGKLHRLSWSS